MVDPFVNHDIIDSGPFGRVIVQDLSDEVTGRFTDLYIIGEVVGVHSDSLVSRLDVAGLERWLSNDQRVDYDTDRPDIDFVRVTLFALEHLRCDIVRSTANRTLPFAIELELGGKTKIADLHFHLVVKEQVTQF